MTEHVRQKNAVQEIDDTELISSAIDKCNLKPEYKRLLKILYVERGCLEDAQIAAQAQKIFGLELAASQQAQNQYLVSQLGCKAPVPAFNVPAPWQYGNYGCSDCSNY